VIGGGAIGSAIADLLLNDTECVGIAVTHRSPPTILNEHDCRLQNLQLDLTSEDSIKECFAAVSQHWPSIEKIFVTSGLLHNDKIKPEKSLSQITPEAMLLNWQVNALGPLLIAKYAEPLLKRASEPSLFAVLSARVGSIEDNRLGGWYGYRMAKAALNMGLKNIAIEWRRKRLSAICVALHPGTTDSPLSEPFQKNVPENSLFSPQRAAKQLLEVCDGLKPEESGSFYSWQGIKIPW
jgi:NAD(P)-dependent dehydrogenase (short-subunit alcohol dehydrogenase family)